MPRKSLICFLAILLATALGIDRAFSEDKYYKEMTTFARIFHEVLKNYVTEPDEQQLFEGAYRGMLRTLDPYSQYFNRDQNKTFAADTEGEFGGLGIEISLRDGLLTVVSPIRGTPAYDAGILAGDVILAIDGQSTERISLNEAVGILRGKPGTEVTLTVRHPGSLVDSKIKVMRAVIHPAAVEFEMIDRKRGIAFIRITSFSAQVMSDLHKAVEELREQNFKALILDLRQNPGGLLEQAVEMCDEFLRGGIIVSVKGRHAEQLKSFKAQPGQSLESVPMVLLVDEGSASASEIVAGALRDHRRAIIVGTRTYGKGSVQNVIPLGNGDALKLTTAKYYTPNDKPIEDRKGIEPDIVVPMSQDHLFALRNQEREDKLRGTYHLGGLIINSEESEPTGAGEPPATPEEEKARRSRVIDYQLKAAYELLKWQLAGVPQAVLAAE